MNDSKFFQPTGISEEVFRQIETVQNRYDSSTAAAFRAVQKSGEMVVRTLDPRQFIRLASETAPKINIDTNVSNYDLIFKDVVEIGQNKTGLLCSELWPIVPPSLSQISMAINWTYSISEIRLLMYPEGCSTFFLKPIPTVVQNWYNYINMERK